MGKDYGWKRFWCPREGSYSLADNGFLVDPEGKYGEEFNPDLVTFDQLHEIPCLALLGEPGIGKSRTMHSNASAAKAVEHGGKSIHLDLRQFGSEDRLLRSLFESDVFCDWQNGQHDLHIFLDSLDECLLRIDNVASLLADEIPKYPTARLKLRIACRTASWPGILERVLSEAYGDERFGVFELAPLRRIDVEKAGTVAGVAEVDQLLRRIEELGVVSFAIKPITLNFLLSTYQRNGDIPASAATLYESGCLILCEEQNESRLASGRRGILSPSERLAVASRIAAATQLGNRFAVWTGSSAAPPPQEDVPLDDLTGAIEFEQRQLTVTIQALRETLDTGLFSSRGSERLGWAHQTYAEFLTARYCDEMPIQQLRSILFHPRRKRVIPQLREVAAWIALKNTELFREIAQNDPEVLLGISASALSDSQRAATTSGLLKSCEQSQVLHLKTEISSALRNLAYPGLSAQISKVLLDKTRQPSARHLVIDIARRCKIADLADDLATIALDQSEPLQLREPAAFTVSEIGSPEARIRLRPLAEASAAGDVREECKGAALRALWPGLIGPDDLFRHLTPRRDSSLYGLYDDFLSHSVLPHLKPADVPTALRWYAVQQHHQIGSAARHTLPRLGARRARWGGQAAGGDASTAHFGADADFRGKQALQNRVVNSSRFRQASLPAEGVASALGQP